MTRTFVSALVFALLTSVSVASLAASSEPTGTAPATVTTVAAVNLNTADADTLTRELKGIGETKAKAIVAYRETHGPFTSVDELLEVNGIGTATLEKNRAILGLN